MGWNLNFAKFTRSDWHRNPPTILRFALLYLGLNLRPPVHQVSDFIWTAVDDDHRLSRKKQMSPFSLNAMIWCGFLAIFLSAE
jgi:hypothetical protein